MSAPGGAKQAEEPVDWDSLVVGGPARTADSTPPPLQERVALLGEGHVDADCDTIRAFLLLLLQRWAGELQEREDAAKRTAQGKQEALTYKQTAANVRPLLERLVKRSCEHDIRLHLVHITRLCVAERDYLGATNVYMELAIGNAPWPVGVTRSGIHQRPGSAKSYVSNVAHVLNDEVMRKCIHALKRLMTKCQQYFPSEPSRCVEYVRPR